MSAFQEALQAIILFGTVFIVFPVCLFTGEIIKDYYLKGDYKNDNLARRSHRRSGRQ